MKTTFTTAKDSTISLTLNGKQKVGMFTHKNSGMIEKKKKKSQYRVVLGLLFYECVFLVIL